MQVCVITYFVPTEISIRYRLNYRIDIATCDGGQYSKRWQKTLREKKQKTLRAAYSRRGKVGKGIFENLIDMLVGSK